MKPESTYSTLENLIAEWRRKVKVFKASAIEEREAGRNEEARVRTGWAGCYEECADGLERTIQSSLPHKTKGGCE